MLTSTSPYCCHLQRHTIMSLISYANM